jgi:hypothetical protein
MTEAEWLVCVNARAMLAFLGDQANERKLRLFTCACWRRRWPQFADPGSARAVATAERYADRLCPWAEVKAAHEEAEASRFAAAQALAAVTWGSDRPAFRAAQDRQRAASAAELTAVAGYAFAAGQVLRLAQEGATKRQRAGWAELVREVFGNPFRAAAIDQVFLSRNGGLALRVAHSIYDENRFSDVGVLGDALEEAGATGELVEHLRSPSPHVRGCWALDVCRLTTWLIPVKRGRG